LRGVYLAWRLPVSGHTSLEAFGSAKSSCGSGEGKHASYNNETVKRLEDIETLDGNTKSVLFNIIDTFLRDAKARKAYAH